MYKNPTIEISPPKSSTRHLALRGTFDPRYFPYVSLIIALALLLLLNKDIADQAMNTNDLRIAYAVILFLFLPTLIWIFRKITCTEKIKYSYELNGQSIILNKNLIIDLSDIIEVHVCHRLNEIDQKDYFSGQNFFFRCGQIIPTEGVAHKSFMRWSRYSTGLQSFDLELFMGFMKDYCYDIRIVTRDFNVTVFPDLTLEDAKRCAVRMCELLNLNAHGEDIKTNYVWRKFCIPQKSQ